MAFGFTSGDIAMTPLRQRMTEDMQLRGLALATQQAYLRYVEQLALFILAHFVKTAIRLVFRAVVSFHSGGMLATRHAARSKHYPNRLVAEGHAQIVGAAA
jgi:hypothetical protein